MPSGSDEHTDSVAAALAALKKAADSLSETAAAQRPRQTRTSSRRHRIRVARTKRRSATTSTCGSRGARECRGDHRSQSVAAERHTCPTAGWSDPAHRVLLTLGG